jgi:hypothetical protein
MLKLYLDNDVFSAMIAKHEPDMREIENAAIIRIRRMATRGEVLLVTSEVHRREIAKVPGQYRSSYQTALGTLPQVQFIDDHTLRGFNTVGDPRGGFVTGPVMEPDDTARALWNLGVKQVDAHHLMLAIRNRCDVLLTCDRGILARREKIQGKFSIRVAKPSEFAP